MQTQVNHFSQLQQTLIIHNQSYLFCMNDSKIQSVCTWSRTKIARECFLALSVKFKHACRSSFES